MFMSDESHTKNFDLRAGFEHRWRHSTLFSAVLYLDRTSLEILRSNVNCLDFNLFQSSELVIDSFPTGIVLTIGRRKPVDRARR